MKALTNPVLAYFVPMTSMKLIIPAANITPSPMIVEMDMHHSIRGMSANLRERRQIHNTCSARLVFPTNISISFYKIIYRSNHLLDLLGPITSIFQQAYIQRRMHFKKKTTS